MKNYRQLKVWQKGIELVKQTYLLTENLPENEKFGIISQINRAAVSIPANIAEGSSRNSDKDYGRFIQIALGSAFELQTYFVVVKDLKWNVPDMENIDNLLEEIIKMLHSFLKQLKTQAIG